MLSHWTWFLLQLLVWLDLARRNEAASLILVLWSCQVTHQVWAVPANHLLGMGMLECLTWCNLHHTSQVHQFMKIQSRPQAMSLTVSGLLMLSVQNYLPNLEACTETAVPDIVQFEFYCSHTDEDVVLQTCFWPSPLRISAGYIFCWVYQRSPQLFRPLSHTLQVWWHPMLHSVNRQLYTTSNINRRQPNPTTIPM